MTNTTNIPKIGNELIQLIKTGKSSRLNGSNDHKYIDLAVLCIRKIKPLLKEHHQNRIETLAEKQMKSSLHAIFLQNCIESECVPEGMLLKKKIYVVKN